MVNLPLFACLFVCFKLHHRCSHLVSWAFGMLAASPCKTHSYWYHLKFMFDLGQIKAHIESTFQTIYSCNVDFVKCGCFVNPCEWFSCFVFFPFFGCYCLSLCPQRRGIFFFSCMSSQSACVQVAPLSTLLLHNILHWNGCQPFFIINCYTVEQS